MKRRIDKKAVATCAAFLVCAVSLLLCSDALAQDTGENLATLRSGVEVSWADRLRSFVGMFGLLGIAWLLSSDRGRVSPRVVGWGLGLQLVFAFLILKVPAGQAIFSWLNGAVVKLLGFTEDGSRFLFGNYLDSQFTVALNVLPTIIFFSSLMAVAYHLGLMHRVVGLLASLMRKTMGTSGSETLSAAANIFVGQTEAPLVVKPYIDKMTLSELHAIMVGGFATVAGGVLAAYVGMLKDHFPDIAGHLIAASVMSAPAALVFAKIMLPETEQSETSLSTEPSPYRTGAPVSSDKKVTELASLDVNMIDAAARGAKEGLTLALNVGAMLLAFLALLAMCNYLIGVPVDLYNSVFDTKWLPLTLEGILGYVFLPIAFLMGIPMNECATVGGLLGEKIILTEFVAYLHLGEMLKEGSNLSPRSVVIATYALCGFANIGSIAIQIGGISAIAPARRGDLAKLGFRAMIAGTLAACMTGTIAGMLL